MVLMRVMMKLMMRMKKLMTTIIPLMIMAVNIFRVPTLGQHSVKFFACIVSFNL